VATRLQNIGRSDGTRNPASNVTKQRSKTELHVISSKTRRAPSAFSFSFHIINNLCSAYEARAQNRRKTALCDDRHRHKSFAVYEDEPS
jgi:hypothetical protein